ncbi:hypothetical protein [Bartonella sp. AA86SXKL]
MPLSLAEIEANHDFLRAQHAVELANNQQKYEFLQKKYVQQKIQLSQVTEQFYRLCLPTKDTLTKEAIAIKQNIATLYTSKGKTNDA